MKRHKKITPYRRRVLAKLFAHGPLTLEEAAITSNIMPTLLAFGWVRPTAVDQFEITEEGQEALSS